MRYKLKKTRFIKAYFTTFSIISRYIFLMIVSKLLSEVRAQALYKLSHIKTARQITKTLKDLKGIYIKIGQTLSVMGNILPADLVQGLESLQDKVPSHPFEEVNKRFLSDFGKSAEELYDRIDPEPIASASLGQVHIAYHKNGEKLAVKLQYPDIESITHRDLKTIKNIFTLIHFMFPQYNLRSVFDECAHIILEELDYTIEARNIQEINKNFENDEKIVFPKVYTELSSKKVLTLGFIEGNKVTNVDKIKAAGFDTRQLATDLIHFYCKQIFLDGHYHADPHPGNIIITPEGKIGMIDFGATATVSPNMRQGMTEFVEGLIKKDSKMLSGALEQMGFLAKKDDDETLEKVVDYFYSKIRGIKIDNFKNLDVSQFQNLNDLIELKKLDISFKELTTLFVVPRDWILLERTMILMTGLTSELDETLNPVEIVIPYVEKFLLGDDNKKLTEILLSTSKDVILSYINLPDDIRKFIKKIKNDGLRVNSKPIKKELAGIKYAVRSIATVILAASTGFLSYLFYFKGMPDVGFRFELTFYAACALFLLSLIKR